MNLPLETLDDFQRVDVTIRLQRESGNWPPFAGFQIQSMIGMRIRLLTRIEVGIDFLRTYVPKSMTGRLF
jgi:hypothetical protein